MLKAQDLSVSSLIICINSEENFGIMQDLKVSLNVLINLGNGSYAVTSEIVRLLRYVFEAAP